MDARSLRDRQLCARRLQLLGGAGRDLAGLGQDRSGYLARSPARSGRGHGAIRLSGRQPRQREHLVASRLSSLQRDESLSISRGQRIRFSSFGDREHRSRMEDRDRDDAGGRAPLRRTELSRRCRHAVLRGSVRSRQRADLRDVGPLCHISLGKRDRRRPGRRLGGAQARDSGRGERVR